MACVGWRDRAGPSSLRTIDSAGSVVCSSSRWLDSDLCSGGFGCDVSVDPGIEMAVEMRLSDVCLFVTLFMLATCLVTRQ